MQPALRWRNSRLPKGRAKRPALGHALCHFEGQASRARPLLGRGGVDLTRPPVAGGSLLSESAMLYWAAVFFVIAIIAGILGFGGVSAAAAGVAQVLFFIFVVIFLITLIMGFDRRRSGPI